MIKITRTNSCKSYFKEKDLYDLKRERDHKIIIFGWTIYHTSEKYDCDLIDDMNSNSIGFKKK